MNTFEKIRFLCRDNGFEISSLSKYIPDVNITRSTATRWKQGAIPRATTLKPIADYFGVTIESLTDDKSEIVYKDKPQEQKTGQEIGFDDFDIALKQITSEYSEEQKKMLLEMAKILQKK